MKETRIWRCIFFAILMILSISLWPQMSYAADSSNTVRSNESVMLSYSTHIQRQGWSTNKYNGERAGTVGSCLRLEALKINAYNIREYTGDVLYRSHVQTYGWEEEWRKDGEISGTEGEAKRLEAVQIKLTGELAEKYDVYYRVHVQTFGWLDWASNGVAAGSEGYSKRLEAIEIVLVDKGDKSPGEDAYSYLNRSKGVGYTTHVQTLGWQDEKMNGTEAGTVGMAKRLESIKINLWDCPYEGNIEYKSHIQTYGWETNWKKNGEKSGTEGQAKRLEAVRIRLTGELAEKYDVYYRVHCQRFGWLGWVKNGEEAGTSGFSYRMEGIQILLLPKNARTFEETAGFYDKNDVEEIAEWQISDIITNLEELTCNTNTNIELKNALESTCDHTIVCRYSWYNNSTKETGDIGKTTVGNSVVWTPMVSGNYTITVTAEDELLRTVIKQVTIQVVRETISREDAFFTAHRGLSSQAPDNSVPAFVLAGVSGFDSIETDVIETKDGVFMISHDDSLINSCGVDENVSELTYEQLSDYEIYHISAGANVTNYSSYELRIPTINDFLDICIQYGCIPQLDIKNLNSFESVRELYNILCQYGLQDSAIVTSFNNLYLQSLREINDNMTLTYGVDSTQYLDYNWLQNYNIGVSVQYNNILSGNFSELKERGIDINVYTVKDRTTAGILIDKGVMSMTTDTILWE